MPFLHCKSSRTLLGPVWYSSADLLQRRSQPPAFSALRAYALVPNRPLSIAIFIVSVAPMGLNLVRSNQTSQSRYVHQLHYLHALVTIRVSSAWSDLADRAVCWNR